MHLRLVVRLALIEHHWHGIILDSLTDAGLGRRTQRVECQVPKARSSHLVDDGRLARPLVAGDPAVRAPLQSAAHDGRRNPSGQQVAIDRRVPADPVAQLTDHAPVFVRRLGLIVIDIDDQVLSLLVNPLAANANERCLLHRRAGSRDHQLVASVQDDAVNAVLSLVDPDTTPTQTARIIDADLVAAVHHRQASLDPVDAFTISLALRRTPEASIRIDRPASALGHERRRCILFDDEVLLRHDVIEVPVIPKAAILTLRALIRVLRLNLFRRRRIDLGDGCALQLTLEQRCDL